MSSVRLALLVSAVVLAVGCPWFRGGDPSRKRLVADNTLCHVCHWKYVEEELAVTHARANVGCASCHGQSDPHCSDEDNLTPPDLMYPAPRINPSCMHCHGEASLRKVDTHKPLLAGTATTKKLCTDCHGDHRLARRSVRWDKATGKLLPDD